MVPLHETQHGYLSCWIALNKIWEITENSMGRHNWGRAEES